MGESMTAVEAYEHLDTLTGLWAYSKPPSQEAMTTVLENLRQAAAGRPDARGQRLHDTVARELLWYQGLQLVPFW